MEFLLLLFIGMIAHYAFGHLAKRCTNAAYIFFFIPYISFFVFVAGGQLGVGTDYESYHLICVDPDALDYFRQKGEYGFYYFVKVFQTFKLPGQIIFYVFSLLHFSLYLWIIRISIHKEYVLYFFLFVTVSTMIHTQMNTLRQCTSVYIVTLAFLQLINGKKLQYIVLILLGTTFHISTIALLPFVLIKRISISSYKCKILVIITAVVSFIPLDSIIAGLIANIPVYGRYAGSEYLANGIPLMGKLSKLVFVPLYYLSAVSYYKNNDSTKENLLLQLGYWGYFIKTISLASSVTYRFGHFFFILSLYPLYFYLADLKRNNYKIFLLWCTYILGMYVIKVVLFPAGEYLYQSIYSEWF